MESEQLNGSSAALQRWGVSALHGWRHEPAQPVQGGLLDVQRWVALLRRRGPMLLAVASVIFAGFVLKTMLDQPMYTAQVEIVVDTRHEQIIDAKPVVQDLPRSTQEANVVDTQVAMLRSRQLAASVVRKLNLVNDPEFNGDLAPASGPLAWLSGSPQSTSPSPKSDAQTREKVVDALLGRLAIKRKGLTYVIGITVTTADPEKSARIANAYANNFLSMNWDSKADATRRVNEWVSGRLGGLRRQVEQSEADVQNYKIANNLLSASGVPLSEAEISNYSQQAATARAALAEDLARLNTARAQLARGSSGDDVGEALGSDVVMELRKQRALISARYAGLERRYGPRHPDLQTAERELADIDAQIQAEIGRVISNLEAKVQVSRQRLASVQGSLGGAQGVLAANNRAAVRLNELQRNADAAKGIYESFLNRYKETSAMAGMVAPDARLVSWASVPTEASSPNLKLNLALGALVGLMAGLAAALAAEMLNSGLSTSEDVEEGIGVPCLGSVPLLRRNGASPSAYLVSKPRSAFAEAFKVLQTSLLHLGDDVPPRVLAITSSLPGEGKTATAACFAGSLAQQGYKTILVDCDEHRASLSNQLGAVGLGLLEVLQGYCTLEEALLRDEGTGTTFLPLVPAVDAPRDLVVSDAMKDLLERLRSEYDIVILDTKPVLGVADTRVLAPMADAVIFLARWRKTPRRAVVASLKILERTGARIAGLALTQVDMKQQARTGYGDPEYYHSKYKGHYVD